MPRSRLTFMSAAAAKIAGDQDSSSEEEEPGEVIESAPPLRVGEEREIGVAGGGLRKKLLRPGRGWATPMIGDEVTLHYVGTLLDGSKFDSTRDRGEPITFTIGQGEVVKGLYDGLVTMKKGELALFTIPPALGFGEAGGHGVPPSAHLLFEVELISWLKVVDICNDGGIVKKVLEDGDDSLTGDLDEVTVKYQIRLLDGSVVCESSEGGNRFSISEGYLCPALPKIVKTMKRGEKAVVNVQPKYALGDQGRSADDRYPAIPPNATITMDVELVSLKPVLDVTGDMKVLKKIFKAGEGLRKPKDGEAVRVTYTAVLEDGTIFENVGCDGEPYEFFVGEAQVISGLDRAVATMLKGEVSQVTVKPEYGYGSEEVKRDLAVIPPCSTLIFEVEMVDFMKEKEAWEMNVNEKLEAAERNKSLGNELYKNGEFERAAKKYDKAVSYIADDGSVESADEKLLKDLRVSCLLNHAACSLKLNNYQEAIRLCSKVLDTEFHNVKALYRRAQAYMETADLDLASLDIMKAMEIDPQNREVKSLQVTLKKLQSERNKRDAKLYANMFDDRIKKDTNVALKKLKVEKSQETDEAEIQSMEVQYSAGTTREAKSA